MNSVQQPPPGSAGRSVAALQSMRHAHQDGRQILADRPLTSHLELGPLLSGASTARLHTRVMLAEWGLADLAETAELLVSELTTNAIQASRALRQPLPSPIHLWLHANHQGLQVMVWDADPQPPMLHAADGDAESGRGLQIVEVLSEYWGWYAAGDHGGKWVWCELTISVSFLVAPAASGRRGLPVTH
jgi:anti-sigma regulatory factor (Ser/Thr protein kinase)